MTNGRKTLWWLVFWVGILVVSLIMCCSCATKTKIEYVDREVVRYETKIQHDTLINNIHDSIYHTVYQKGDTVYDVKYKEIVKFRDKVVIKTDTCWRDSIQVQTKEVTRVKKVTPKWCYLSLLGCLVAVVLLIFKVKKWIGLG